MLRIDYRNSILSTLKTLYAIFVFVTEVMTLSGNYRPISILNDSRNSLKTTSKLSSLPPVQADVCLSHRELFPLPLPWTLFPEGADRMRGISNLFTDRRTVCKHVCARSGAAAADSPPSRPENCSFTAQLTVMRWKRSLCVQDVSGSINSVC